MFKLSSKERKAGALLCTYVLDAIGTQSEIAHKTNVPRQYVYRWMQEGCVTLTKSYDVAELADTVTPWHVSYLKLAPVFGEDSPDLPGLIKSAPILEVAKEFILKILK
jgi:hypothetical protein